MVSILKPVSCVIFELKPVYCLVMLFGGPVEVILCCWIPYRFIFRLVKPYDVYSYYDVLRDFKINKKGKLLFIELLGCGL